MCKLETRINPTHDYINEWVPLEDGKVAHRYGICLTNIVCYAVYEPSRLFGGHSTITFDYEHTCYGDITTRALTLELDALPAYSEERSQAVRAYHKAQEDEAEHIIRQAFPADFAQAEVQA